MQKQIIDFISQQKFDYCAVRTGPLNAIQVDLSLQRVKVTCFVKDICKTINIFIQWDLSVQNILVI